MIEVIQESWRIGGGRRCVKVDFENGAFLAHTKAGSLFTVGRWDIVEMIGRLLCFEGLGLDRTAGVKSFGFAKAELEFRGRTIQGVH